MGRGKQNKDAGELMSLWPAEGFAGISKAGVFGALPDWVNPKLPPGHTSQVDLLGLDKTVWDIATLKHFVFSPNLTWFVVAVALHVAIPYDFEAAKSGFWYVLGGQDHVHAACAQLIMFLFHFSNAPYQAVRMDSQAFCTQLWRRPGVLLLLLLLPLRPQPLAGEAQVSPGQLAHRLEHGTQSVLLESRHRAVDVSLTLFVSVRGWRGRRAAKEKEPQLNQTLNRSIIQVVGGGDVSSLGDGSRRLRELRRHRCRQDRSRHQRGHYPPHPGLARPALLHRPPLPSHKRYLHVRAQAGTFRAK